MFGIVENNKFLFIDKDLEKLKNTLIFLPDYNEKSIKEYDLAEIEQAYTGEWYLEGYAPQKPLEELKAEKIVELKANCQNYILSVYPIYKQLNVINPLNNYSNEDKLAMNTFIDDQRAICASKEEEINNSTLENIDSISTNFGD